MRTAVVPTLHSDCRHPGDDWMLPSWTVALSSSNSEFSRDTVTRVEQRRGQLGSPTRAASCGGLASYPQPPLAGFQDCLPLRAAAREGGQAGPAAGHPLCAQPSSAPHTRVFCTPALLLFPLCRVGQDSHTGVLWAHVCPYPFPVG